MGSNDNNSPGKHRRIDLNSIKATTMVSFALFAVIIIAMIWGLTTTLVNKYYDAMRIQSTIHTASSLEEEFQHNPLGFDDYASNTAKSNGMYIRIDTDYATLVYDGSASTLSSSTTSRDISVLKEKLQSSPLKAVTLKSSGSPDADSRLMYATHIKTLDGTTTLYIIAPLYADAVTLRIIISVLFYISLFVLGFALLLAMLLSNKLASPIENITRSAKLLSQGNHSARFDATGFTETKELARTLNQASYEMEKTEFYQREILANVSHDLKTPLTMIRSYAEKIIDISGNNPEKRESDLHVIISETERLNRLVTEMMTVSNLQSHNVELHKEVFNIVEVAEEVVESFIVLNSSEGYDIQFHPCKPVYVYGDRTRLAQVMSNFVSNAVKYSGDNRFVDIQLKRNGKKFIFHCIDHGVGIPADELSHVWDRYYRTSANHERDIQGTGLGLSIVKGILTLHDAEFGVNSQEGAGSDFWFELDTVRKPVERDNSSRENNK